MARLLLNGLIRRFLMKDLVLLVVTVAFFALTWAYARSFERL